MMAKSKFFLKIIFSFGLLLFVPGVSQAATLYLESVGDTFGPGETFKVRVKLDVDDECINTAEVKIAFPKDIVRFKDFSDGQSFFSLWVDKPSSRNADSINEAGIVTFAGGIPGGYCGKIPGDPGESNVTGDIIFSVPNYVFEDGSSQLAKLDFAAGTRVLLNDGRGTEDRLQTKPLEVLIDGKKSLINENWQNEVAADTVKPDPFVIELRQEEGMFDNQYFIIFSANDKQTGIDHYEVLEIRPDEKLGETPKRSLLDILFGRRKSAPLWNTALSPYPLKDQSLESTVKVKAVDKAGNERVSEYIPSQYKITGDREKSTQIYLFVSIGAGLIVVLAAAVLIARRKK